MHRASRCQELNAYNIVWVHTGKVRGEKSATAVHAWTCRRVNTDELSCPFRDAMRAVYVVNCLVMFVIRMQMAFTVVVMHVLVCVSLSRSCWTKRPVAVLILSYGGINHAFGRLDIVRLWQAAFAGY